MVRAMKIEDRKSVPVARPASGAQATGAVVSRRVEPPASPARAVADTTTVLGVPEAELTPKVREAIMELMREVESLRLELGRTKARLADLERLADQDTLVPLYNRRAFIREMARVRSFAERYGGQASLVFFDLNGLKQINDTFGHAAGDAALRQVAHVLIENVRESDIVGRLGGDEFGVILAQASERQALEKGEALALAIRRRPLCWEGKELLLDIAFGIYAFKPGEDPSTALAAADKAMYRYKANAKEQP
jgi:diguanylate cyclase (GGDEF)-like protein